MPGPSRPPPAPAGSPHRRTAAADIILAPRAPMSSPPRRIDVIRLGEGDDVACGGRATIASTEAPARSPHRGRGDDRLVDTPVPTGETVGAAATSASRWPRPPDASSDEFPGTTVDAVRVLAVPHEPPNSRQPPRPAGTARLMAAVLVPYPARRSGAAARLAAVLRRVAGMRHSRWIPRAAGRGCGLHPDDAAVYGPWATSSDAPGVGP